jgi:hypothetical protein
MPDLGKLDQTSTTNAALKLMSLMQITAVKANGNGVDVFFTSSSSSQGSSEITINLANGKPTVSNAKVLSGTQTHALEVQFNLDINGNGIVGTPAINTYSTTKNDAFVAGLYSSVLNRATPDPEGQQFWVTALNNGQSKVNVISSFLKSSEAHSKLATDAHFINFSYQQILGRSPDATGESFWLTQIKNGASHDTVIDAIASSSELAQLVGTLKIA